MRLATRPFTALVTAVAALALATSALASPAAHGMNAGADPAATSAAKPGTGTVSGTVTYRGKPVAGAYVVLKGDTVKRTRTDARGRFSRKAPAGRYVVSAWAKEPNVFETFVGDTTRLPDAKSTKVRTGRTARVSIDLVPAATVQGRVVRANGRPAKHAGLEAVSLGRHGGVEEIVTDAKGRYTVAGLPRGQVEILAGARGAGRFGQRGTVTVRAKTGRTVTAPVIRLAKAPRGTLIVRVDRDATDEHVRAYSPKTGAWESLTYRPAKDLWSGKVPVGRWRVVVAGTNAATKAVRVRKGQKVDAGYLDARSERSDLTGQVLDTDGQPVPAGQVTVEDRFGNPVGWSALDSQGRFELTGLAPGKHTVRALSDDKSRGLPASAAVRLTAGAPAQVTLRLVEAYTVRGRIVHQGRGVRGIRVILLPGKAVTGAKGKFQLEGIPAGTHTLRVRDYLENGYRFKDLEVEVTGNTKGVRVKVKR